MLSDMDMDSAKWFSELGNVIEDYNYFMNQYEKNSLTNNLITQNIGESMRHESISPDSKSSNITFNTMPINKPYQPNSQVLSFESDNSQHLLNRNLGGSAIKPKIEVGVAGEDHFKLQPTTSLAPKLGNPIYETKGIKRSYSSMNRSPSHAKDHILAERKRREKLSERFVALSSIIPGLKKMDKASILTDAIKYVKKIEERVKLLEEQTKKRTIESVVFLKKSKVSTSDHDDSSSSVINDEGDSSGWSGSSLLEIEAKVSDKDVLIRVHCEKQEGVDVKILAEVRSLHLQIVNCNILEFGDFILEVTIIAKMKNEFCLTMKDLVQNLRMALLD